MESLECAGCRQRDAIIAELTAKIAAMEQRLAQQDRRIAELEARLKTNSSNSSMPPSSDPPWAPPSCAKPPTGRKPGGQPGHPGHSRPRLEPHQIVPHVPSHCGHCHASLPSPSSPTDPPPTWHQVIELPAVMAVVTEHQGQARTCPRCGRLTWGQIPPEVLAHGFGPKLTAALAFFSGRCHVSKRDIEEMLRTLFGVPLSLGSVANAEQETAAALKQPYAQAQTAVREAPVKNADETGWAQAGQRRWMWLAVADRAALFKIDPERGSLGLGALLGYSIKGIVGSDRWGVYGRIDLASRQLCWAHLKRDFQKWVDRSPQTAWIGQIGLEAVGRLFAIWRRFRQGVLDRPGMQAALEPVRQDLHAALKNGVQDADKSVARFCRNLVAVYPALWTFAQVEGVEPTNNLAERTLRPAVIWRKISFGNHSEDGCRFVERILTTIQTLRLQGRHVLHYLRDAIAAHRADQPCPVLVPDGA
jgi:transposase